MGLVGLIFIVYALIVLFDILVQLLKNCNVVDLGKMRNGANSVSLKQLLC